MKPIERRIVFQSLLFLSATVLVVLILLASQERRLVRLQTQLEVKQQPVTIQHMTIETPIQTKVYQGLPGMEEAVQAGKAEEKE